MGWAQNTSADQRLRQTTTRMLAVATNDRSYAFLVPSRRPAAAPTRSTPSAATRSSPRCAAATGRCGDRGRQRARPRRAPGSGTPASISWVPVLIIAAILLLVICCWSCGVGTGKRKRHEAEVAAADRVDPTDPDALAAVPLDALDDLSRSIVVDVDNAVRTSSNELALAVEEFGDAADRSRSPRPSRTPRPRWQAGVQRPPAARRRDARDRRAAARSADPGDRRRRAAPTASWRPRPEAFHQLRDLVINAPDRLDALTQQLVDVTARIDPSQQKLTAAAQRIRRLRAGFGGPQRQRPPRSGWPSPTRTSAAAASWWPSPPQASRANWSTACEAAESALRQASAMLDAVDSAASDIRHAVGTLPSAITDIQNGINQAATQLAQGDAGQRHRTVGGARCRGQSRRRPRRAPVRPTRWARSPS